MAKKVDEQLWVRVLELEQALKEQEKQTKQSIDELAQQYHDNHNHLPALDQLRINMRNRKKRVSMAYLVALFSMVSCFMVLIVC